MTNLRGIIEFNEDKSKLFTNLKTNSNMNIRKVVLADEGFKGAVIEFFQEEEKNGRKQLVLTKKYPHNPVHLGLEKMFKELRIHLLQICGLINDEMDTNIQAQVVLETIVDTIELDTETITLSGTKQVFENKYIKLKTCKLQDADNYVQFDMLNDLIQNICVETEEYLAGTKKVDDTEVAVRYVEMGKAKGVNIEEVKALPPDQLKDWATKVLESGFGSFVIHAEDMETDEKNVMEVVEELKTEFEVSEGETVIELQVAEKKTKGKGKGKKEAAHELAAVTEPVGNSPVPEEEF